jgi:hypothetical protein
MGWLSPAVREHPGRGKPNWEAHTMNATCSLGDGRPVYAYGWCNRHYQKWRKYGDPLIVRHITGVDERTRFEMRVDRSGGPDDCHPWQGKPDSGGYGRFEFEGKTRRAHAVAWEFVHGPVPPGKELDHECHNQAVRSGACSPGPCAHRLCCNERHLIARTRKEHKAEEANGRARLTATQVLEIRQLLAEGERSMSAIARQYGVVVSSIANIRDGRTWSTLRA